MKPVLLMAVALALGGLLFPFVGGSFDMMVRILIWGIMGLGFDILFGYAGLLSFGSAAFFGTGGFVAGLLLVGGATSSVWLALVVGTLAAGALGLVLGVLAVRRIGIYFARITLAFGQMAYFLENGALSRWTGGENGLPGVPLPSLFGHRVAPGAELYALLAVLFLAGYALALRIVGSPFGLVLSGIKGNTARAAMLGPDVPRYKLAAFVIAALYAGFAGGLLGSVQSYMPPDAFALDTSGQLVMQTIIGGVGTLVGPLMGAVVWLWLRDLLQLVPGMGALWRLVLGVVFIALVVGLRRGIWGEFLFLRRRRTPAIPRDVAAAEPPLRAPALLDSVPALVAEGLAKHYGGLRAVDDVSFTVQTGTIHGVIGPNGAGKSTLFKMLLDEVHPTTGQVRLFGQAITGMGATRTAQLGIGKSNQLNQLFLDLTVRENLRLAALARRRGAFRLDAFRDAASIPEVERQVDAAMGTVDLGARADVPAGLLAYGEKRRLEIGLALATGPNVLLLDEPLAGMSPAERVATRALIKQIGRTRTIVVVEHDMDAVFDLADRITVLQEGRLLADGTPEQIQGDARVQAAYLGGFAAEALHEPA
jgi:branched-chain amino acid transport system permease protein